MRFDIKIETNDDNEFIVWATCRSLNWDVWGKADTLEKAIKEFDKEFKELVVNKHDALDAIKEVRNKFGTRRE